MGKLDISYQNHAMKAAKDLGYGLDVMKDIKAATSNVEIERIMISARKRKWGDGLDKRQDFGGGPAAPKFMKYVR